MPDQLLRDNGKFADDAIGRLRRDRPRHLGKIFGRAPDDFAFEIFHDFRAKLLPPHRGAADLISILQREHLGPVGIGIGFFLIVVGDVVAGIGVAVSARPQLRDAQLLHHVSMILLRRPVQRRGRGIGWFSLSGQRTDENHQD